MPRGPLRVPTQIRSRSGPYMGLLLHRRHVDIDAGPVARRQTELPADPGHRLQVGNRFLPQRITGIISQNVARTRSSPMGRRRRVAVGISTHPLPEGTRPAFPPRSVVQQRF
jgi:hypothetical protein